VALVFVHHPDGDRDEKWQTREIIVRDPDPKSRIGAIRLIGYSPSAGFVLTVIVDPIDWAGITAWKARGADLRSYLEGEAVRDD